MKKTYSPNRVNQKNLGFTLIEILIALVLGVFLMGGILQIMLNSQSSYRMQENLSRMQENGRFAMEFITRDIRMVGYKICRSGSIPTALSGTNNDGLNTSDSITIKMSSTACPVVVSTLVYSINNGNGQAALFKKTDASAREELIEGIENMQILYGADTDDDKTPDYYLSAGTAGLNMDQVVSIRITLSAYTLDTNLSTTGDGRLRRTFSSTVALRNLLP